MQTVSKAEARDVSSLAPSGIAYSFCTLVTRLEEYHAMISAFAAKGFTSRDCEYLYVDNSVGNRFDAFSAYNRFLTEARGRYVILCHQDILPLEDGRQKLDFLLDELTISDADWGLCGNAGATQHGELIYHISYPDGEEEMNGLFPKEVMSLDENFIIARREANLALSRDLDGFHWYGSDLCIVAAILGWRAYAIDFHLLHKSRGSMEGSFDAIGKALRKKYAHAFRSRWQHVPMSQPVFISSSTVLTFVSRTANRLRVMWRRVFAVSK